MNRFHFPILYLLLTCVIVRGEAQETVSAGAKKFCDQLRTSASANTLRRVDSVAKNYRSTTISEEDIMNIANSMSRNSNAAMALAMMIVMRISELASDRAIERRRQAIILVNNLYTRIYSRRDQILRSID